jgi:hypothetical protein
LEIRGGWEVQEEKTNSEKKIARLFSIVKFNLIFIEEYGTRTFKNSGFQFTKFYNRTTKAL